MISVLSKENLSSNIDSNIYSKKYTLQI